MSNEVLVAWLLGVIGGPAALGGLAARFVEYAPFVGPWFGKLEYEAKRLVMLGLCAAIGAACVALLYVLGYTVDADLIFHAVQSIGVAYITSQLVHGRMVSNGDA